MENSEKSLPSKPITFGFARMRVEAGERRDFLPDAIALLDRHGAKVFLEYGYGRGMGFNEADYRILAPSAEFVSHQEAYQQDFVVVLRCPGEEELHLLPPKTCLISMLHYPTRPVRTGLVRALGIEAISLDSIKDDNGRRLVENLRAVAWNGIEVAFRTLRTLYSPPGFESPKRLPVRVTLIGAGAVGMHVVQAAIRHGDPALWKEMYERRVPGVQVTTIDYDTTYREDIMRELLARTDILIDATQRPDPTRPVILNDWIGEMPRHAVLLDLSVDPYDLDCEGNAKSVKGIEGIPQGNLDQYVFAPDDPAYDSIPACVSTRQRRYVVSCYSWPGIHPRQCMVVYGHQLSPIFRTLIERGGIQGVRPRGNYFERAIGRAMLSRWNGG
ncbi:MAG: alanine dehydrogenase [Chloroflexota bacterium]